VPHRDWPIDKHLSWAKQPSYRWVKGPYFTNRYERRRQMCREYRARGITRVKVGIGILVAEFRHQKGHSNFAYLKKKSMRRLGLQHKTLDQYTATDFVRVGAEPASSFTAIINASPADK